MDLQEKIARAISPAAWERHGTPEADMSYAWLRGDAMTVAQRVIDALGLQPEHRNEFYGHGFTVPAADRWVTPWVEQPHVETRFTAEEIDDIQERLRVFRIQVEGSCGGRIDMLRDHKGGE